MCYGYFFLVAYYSVNNQYLHVFYSYLKLWVVVSFLILITATPLNVYIIWLKSTISLQHKPVIEVFLLTHFLITFVLPIAYIINEF